MSPIRGEDLQKVVRKLAGEQEEYPSVRIVSSSPESKEGIYHTAAFDEITREITIPENYADPGSPAFKDFLLHELGHYYMRHDIGPKYSYGIMGPEEKGAIIQEMEASLWAAYTQGHMDSGIHNDVETIWTFGGDIAFKRNKKEFISEFRRANKRVSGKLGGSLKLPGFEKALRSIL